MGKNKKRSIEAKKEIQPKTNEDNNDRVRVRRKKKKEPKFKRIKGKIVYLDIGEVYKKINKFQNSRKRMEFFVGDNIAQTAENLIKDLNLCFDRTRVYKSEKFILKPSRGKNDISDEFDEFFNLFKLEEK